MGEISFIHLSDIHFRKTSGNGYDIDSDLRNAVLVDIKHNLKKSLGKVNGVLLSGDIAFAGQEEEYRIAKDFLKEIAIGIEMDETNVYCVPGNHDVDQNISKRSRSVYAAQCDIEGALTLDDADWILEKYMLDTDIPNLLYKTIEQYNKFAAQYRCNIDSQSPIWEQYFELDNNMQLKIVGLNSCIISNHDDHKEEDVVRKMVIGQSQIPKYEDDIVCVSLCHHPVEFWKFIDIMQDRIDKRVDIQLYGHKHEQAVSKTSERLVVNAGATQPTRGKDWRPRYNWVSFECFFKEGDRYIRVKTFPRILSDDRDRFIPDIENCDVGKNFFIYELDIDKKRKKNLYDDEQICCLQKKSVMEEVNLKNLGYDFLNLSDVQRFEIMSELQLIRHEYNGKSASQILDSVLADVQKRMCLNELYELIEKKKFKLRREVVIMLLERMFYKWYKRINLSMDEQQSNNRWVGVQNAISLFENPIDISKLLKLYYRLSFDNSIREQLVECFVSEDKMFDETNEEEMIVLAGGILAELLEGEHKIFTAFSLLILDTYYEAPLKELSDIANDVIFDMAREIKGSKESCLNQIKKITSKEIEEIISETAELTEEETNKLVTIIKTLNKNVNILVNVMEQENKKYQEDIGILSWIIGEWSNILEAPLSEIHKVKGAFVIGAELSDLVMLYPGPYSAKALIKRMLDKCTDDVSEITLTEFIDSQDEAIRSLMAEKYGENCKDRNLPIISAIESSLSVDEAKVWTPVYKKAWKINPDEISFDLLTWSELLYWECMINAY